MQKQRTIPIIIAAVVAILLLALNLAIICGKIGNQEKWRILTAVAGLVLYCSVIIYFLFNVKR